MQHATIRTRESASCTGVGGLRLAAGGRSGSYPDPLSQLVSCPGFSIRQPLRSKTPCAALLPPDATKDQQATHSTPRLWVELGIGSLESPKPPSSRVLHPSLGQFNRPSQSLESKGASRPWC